jgi:hypothetical protein
MNSSTSPKNLFVHLVVAKAIRIFLLSSFPLQSGHPASGLVGIGNVRRQSHHFDAGKDARGASQFLRGQLKRGIGIREGMSRCCLNSAPQADSSFETFAVPVADRAARLTADLTRKDVGNDKGFTVGCHRSLFRS